MYRLLFILFIFPSIIFAQELAPPEISIESGFYEEGFQVDITHSDPTVVLLYTLDGSEPDIDNINGKKWDYKTDYPLNPGDDFGEIKHDTIWTFEYAGPINIADRTPEETVLAEVYTTIVKENVHAEGELFKGNILRVRAYSETTEEYSEIISRNYFITSEGNNRYSVPVVAVSFDNDKYYSYEDGIGVPGIIFDEYRIENPDAPMDGWAPANYREKGKSTEVPINFNYFENGEEILNHNAGLRINGGYTRSFANKSLRLYARNDYGKKNFKHDFFKDYDLNKFKRLLLRNSGNDSGSSFFRDAFMHKMSKNLNFDIQESQPVAVFINGEYDGLRNIRERYDKKYFKRIHDIPEEDLEFLENHIEVKEGDDVFYNEMIDFFNNNSFNDDTTFDQAITFLDPINFTDYYATGIYVANDDWPGNNYLFYRHKTEYNPEEDNGTKDGRFRWLLKDLDRGFFLHTREENGYEANTLEWATQNNESRLIIRKLLENENYKEYFINRFADLLNTTFKEERIVSIIEEFKNLYQPEIEENGRRWKNHISTPGNWNADINRMITFAQNRPTYQREHLTEKFDLEGIFDLALNISDENHGYIHLNSIDIKSSTDGINEIAYPWVGEYFKNIPVTLTAIPEEGYVFSHWSGAVESSEAEISLTLNEDTYLKANFIDEDMSTEEENLTNFSLYPNPTEGMVYIQSKMDFEEFNIFDLQGRIIKSGKITNNSVDLEDLSSGIYFLHLQTNEGEKKQIRVMKK